MSDVNTTPRTTAQAEPFDQSLPVKMTRERHDDFSRQLATLLLEQDTTREEMKDASRGYKNRLELIGQKIKATREPVRTGIIWEPVRCERIFDYQTCTVREYRVDTQELVNDRAMTPEERQMGLYVATVEPKTEPTPETGAVS